MKTPVFGLLLSAASLVVLSAEAPAASTFRERDLVSDLSGRAEHLDAALKNPWGLVVLPGGALRVANNHSGTSTLYGPAGVSIGPTFNIPPVGSGNPTGIRLNAHRAFAISKNGHTAPSRFILASEDGTISAWNPNVDADAITVWTGTDAIYKGLALGRIESGWVLYAANFHAGRVDVFDASFSPLTWAGAFEDPNLPAGYAPFNIENVNGRVFVTYAKQDAAREDDEPGAGFGFVDVFDTHGHLLRRFASGGALNAPWGLAVAPRDFGGFGGAVLIGNFGDGRINAFDWRTGSLLGPLTDAAGAPIQIEGLWSIAFGPGERSGDRDGDDDSRGHGKGHRRGSGDDNRRDLGPRLYFTAGINGEDDGLFGFLTTIGGRRHSHDDDEIAVAGGPAEAALANPANRPAAEFAVATLGANPVRLGGGSGVSFRITTPDAGAVRLRIYDVGGRLVSEPVRGQVVTGSTVVTWDGREISGARVAPGSYFYRAVYGSKTVGGRIVVMP